MPPLTIFECADGNGRTPFFNLGWYAQHLWPSRKRRFRSRNCSVPSRGFSWVSLKPPDHEKTRGEFQIRLRSATALPYRETKGSRRLPRNFHPAADPQLLSNGVVNITLNNITQRQRDARPDGLCCFHSSLFLTLFSALIYFTTNHLAQISTLQQATWHELCAENS